MHFERLLNEIRNESVKFKLGLILIIVSPIVSWIFVPILSIAALSYKNTLFWFLAGAVYIFTWMLTLIGILLAGKRGINIALSIVRKGNDD